ncbi:MAG: keto-deoxy-phosphogluconate aldolase [Verrucomicrobiales bacterium]|nr:keto-deoxy-phosphogluconate aldolase [Verrucomicrobiales bacterium]
MSALTPDSPVGQEILQSRLLAVLVIDDVDAAVPVAEALMAGGVKAMELTLRTDSALDAAKKIRTELPEMMLGIGTVITEDQVVQVADTGAKFAVSPGVNPAIIRKAASLDLPFGPGVMTPTDIDVAVREGCRLLKFFPAESSGGLKHLKNISAPYAHLGLKFVPLGGISTANLTEYLGNDLIGAVGGSWLAPRETIRDKNWKQIEENARTAIGLIEQ